MLNDAEKPCPRPQNQAESGIETEPQFIAPWLVKVWTNDSLLEVLKRLRMPCTAPHAPEMAPERALMPAMIWALA